MDDVFSPELNLPTPSRSPLSAPLRLSFGESALHGTFASAPESPADSVQTDPAVHHSVLLLHPAGCMHTSRATPAAPSVDPRLLSTDRGASLRPLQLQLPSARPFERNACNCAAQQPVCAHDSLLSASHMQAAARVRTQPLEEGVLSSPCSTCSPLAPPPYPPPTPLPNHPKMNADQQYDCAQVAVLSASSGGYAVRARTAPLAEGLLSFRCSTCSPLAPTPYPSSTPLPNQSNLHGFMGSVLSSCCSSSAPFSAAMASPVQGGPRAGVPVAAAVCVTLSPPPPLASTAESHPIAFPAPPTLLQSAVVHGQSVTLQGGSRLTPSTPIPPSSRRRAPRARRPRSPLQCGAVVVPSASHPPASPPCTALVPFA